MVHDALHQLNLDDIDIVFIENVGNLVCPASFDLGQHRNITLLSVTEGDDKPAKYPVMFRAADLVLLTKIDLLQVLGDFSPSKAARHVRDLASDAPVLHVTTRIKGQLDDWCCWLEDEVLNHRERLAQGQTLRPAIQPEGAQLHQHDHHSQQHIHVAK